jgi:hypothetical protein
MKHLHVLIVVFAFAISTSAFAGQAEYDDCILQHLKGARLDLAVSMIRQACEENYRRPDFVAEQKRAYNNCLLEHLVGVESYDAVTNIKQACDSKYQP